MAEDWRGRVNSMRLQDKVALITGGTSGIGEATANIFAKEGAKVAITGRNEKRGKAVAERIINDGGEAVFIRSDVRRAGECRNAVDETLRAFNRLDPGDTDTAMLRSEARQLG